MKNKKILFISLVMLILLSLNSFAIYQLSGITPDTVNSKSLKQGVKWKPTWPMNVTNVSNFNSATVTRCYLESSTRVVLANGTVTNYNCGFNNSVILDNASEYYFLWDNNGVAFNTQFDDGFVAWPLVKESGNFTGAIYNNASDLTTFSLLHNFTYNNISGGLPPPAPSINLTRFSPLNNSQQTNNFYHYFTVYMNNSNITTIRLFINNISVFSDNYASGNNQNISYTAVTTEKINYGQNEYYWYVNSSVTSINTSRYTFYYDAFNVTMITHFINNSYTTRYLPFNFTADHYYLKQVNFSLPCALNYSNASVNIPYTNFNRTLDLNNCSLGQHTITITTTTAPNGSTLRTNVFTYTVNNMAYINITAKSYNGSMINTFDILKNGTYSGSTTNGYYLVNNLSLGTYNITINASNYEYKSQLFNITNSTSYQFLLYSTNSFNFTFRDEKNGTLLEGVNVSVEFISNGAVYNYSTNTSYLYVDLLVPEDYTIRYSADGFGRNRQYYYRLTDKTHTDITLYLINSSDYITVTVYDQDSLNLIEGAVVYLQRYFIDTNEYKTVGMYQTDSAGKSYFDIQKNTEYYKFFVDYPLYTSRLETVPQYIESSNINLYITTSTGVLEDFYNINGILATINFIDATNEFSTTWNDVNGVSTNFCLYVKTYGYYSNSIVNYSCSSSSSGSLSVGGLTTNNTYFATFTATIDGNDNIILTGWKSLITDKLNAGQFGVFFTVILLIVFIFIVRMNIFIPIMASIVILFARLISLIDIEYGYIFMLIAGSIIITIVMSIFERK